MGLEVRDGQGLYGVFKTVDPGQELQHAFVNGARDRETEIRVVAIAHVGEVLVGEEFEQHAGHLRHPALGVGTVPQLAAAPVGLIKGPDVVHDLGLDNVGIIATERAVFAVGVFVIVVG